MGGTASGAAGAAGIPEAADSAVLVTGAGGMVGSEVVARLAAAGRPVIALVHENTRIVRNNGRPVPAEPWDGTAPAPGTVHTCQGDVTRPALGLDTGTYDALAARTGLIVHCAAITDFGRPVRVYQSVNVDGTEHTIELAKAADARLVHVSTAYVCGERDGVVTEDELDVGQSMGNAYEDSKLRAEVLVHKARGDGVQAAIVRPSIVVGAERTGVVRDFKNIYVVLRLATQGRVRFIPGHFDAGLDLVPVDRVADLLMAAADRFPEAEGRTLHAVGRTLTLRDFSDVMAEYPSFHVPRFLPPANFDPERQPEVERMYYDRVVSLYESYFRRRVVFDTEQADRFARRKAMAGGKPFLRRVFDHALKTGYLGSPDASVEQVLARLRGSGA